MTLSYETIRSALAAQPLFEDKTWRLSPEAWPVTGPQLEQLEAIGSACVEFHQALEALYLRSVAGKNLLRNKPLVTPWVADYLDRGSHRRSSNTHAIRGIAARCRSCCARICW
jgi:hypothetical protein